MTTSKHYPVEDMTEAALWNGWCTLKDYLSNMEDHLQKVTEQFEASVNEQKRRSFYPAVCKTYFFMHNTCAAYAIKSTPCFLI